MMTSSAVRSARQSICLVLAGAVLAAVPARAQTLAPALAPVGFLVGHWSSGVGEVAETGGTARGRSEITVEAGGGALLRRDHTDLFDKAGKPMGGFDQVMLIYPEGGGLRADYTDGQHVIHYATAEVAAGRSVTFTSAVVAGAPIFRLSYALTSDQLDVAFAMAPPGQGAFRPVATGVLRRTPAR